LSGLLMWAALATMLIGILGAVAQSEIKRMLSFTLVSHIGYMIFGIGLASSAGYAGAIFYTAHHITIQTTLFLVTGLIEIKGGSTSLNKLGGLAAASPILGILFFIPAMNLAGIPPLSGFVGKVGLLQAGAEHGGFLAYLLIGGGVLTSLLTLYAMAKVWNRAFWRPVSEEADELEGADGEESEDSEDALDELPPGKHLPWPMVATTAALVLVGIGITVVSGPLYGYAERSAADLVGGVSYTRAVLGEGIR
ncbi:MAG: proton-conducting transporter membrane subunit, partial [Propionibacteriaceae bacterium]